MNLSRLFHCSVIKVLCSLQVFCAAELSQSVCCFQQLLQYITSASCCQQLFSFLFLQDLLSSKHNNSVNLTHIIVFVNIFLSFLQAAAKYLSYFGTLNAVSLFIISSDRSNVNTLFSLLRKKIYRPKLSVDDTVRQRSGTVIS